MQINVKANKLKATSSEEHQSKLVQERRQEILKRGSIPEFVQIKNTMDFYQVYQEANHRNRLLVESQHQ